MPKIHHMLKGKNHPELLEGSLVTNGDVNGRLGTPEVYSEEKELTKLIMALLPPASTYALRKTGEHSFCSRNKCSVFPDCSKLFVSLRFTKKE